MSNHVSVKMHLLKRLDLVIAALLSGVAVAPVSSAYLCAESSCRSPSDAARFYGLGALAIAFASIAFWRIRGWALRVLVLVVSLYASYIVPTLAERHGRWTVQADSRSCLVNAGDARDEIRHRCGGPTYACRGPKNVDTDLWNPFSTVVCGFSGDVYANRIVTYNCEGRVAAVTGFDAGSLGDLQPPQCVTRGQAGNSR